MAIPRVAIVVPGLATAGGVPAVAAFLYRTMISSGRYEPYLFSLPMSSRDKSSVRFLAPSSWFRGASIEEGLWNGWPYRHVGAIVTELEFQRYQPRRLLTEALSGYDLIQVVAGTPAWAYAMRGLQQPVLLQVATLTSVERQALLRKSSWARYAWLRVMNRIVSYIEDRALDHLSAVFVENVWLYEYLSQRIESPRVVFAPPGVDTAHFCPGPYRADSYILSVGRLNDPRKNVPLLFAAYHRLRQMMSSAPQLVLAGKTMPDASTWQLAESLGIAEDIITLRDVAPAKLARLYRQASLYVLSSDEEGLGIVILEAMASGIPVIATRCGGPETAVLDGETGYLVPKGDATALASRMYQLLGNPARAKRFGQVARKRAEQEFSLAAAGRRFLQRYDCIVS